MKIGMIGLGKMGYNLTLNALDNGNEVVVYDIIKENIDKLTETSKAVGVSTIEEMIEKLPTPRFIWLMVPSGNPVDDIIHTLAPLLDKGDTIIDGGNSFYKKSIENSLFLETKGINLLDIGTSGGISGARSGACMMIGGKEMIYRRLKPFLDSLCVPGGVEYVGKNGAGHFSKMVHNGIEYGMMQSIGEGFEILEKSEFDFDFEKIGKVWSNGSIIRGLLMELITDSFSKDNNLEQVSASIGQNGEGLWTLETAIRLGVPTPALSGAIHTRFSSGKDNGVFSSKVIQALRQQFGGHDSSVRLKK